MDCKYDNYNESCIGTFNKSNKNPQSDKIKNKGIRTKSVSNNIVESLNLNKLSSHFKSTTQSPRKTDKSDSKFPLSVASKLKEICISSSKSKNPNTDNLIPLKNNDPLFNLVSNLKNDELIDLSLKTTIAIDG